MTVKLNLSGHKNSDLEALGYSDLALHVNLEDADLSQKVAAVLAPLIGSDAVVYIALPGLSPLTAIVLATVHGLTGGFPFVQSLVRTPEGKFVPGPVLDLQSHRNDVTRQNFRQDVTVL